MALTFKLCPRCKGKGREPNLFDLPTLPRRDDSWLDYDCFVRDSNGMRYENYPCRKCEGTKIVVDG